MHLLITNKLIFVKLLNEFYPYILCQVPDQTNPLCILNELRNDELMPIILWSGLCRLMRPSEVFEIGAINVEREKLPDGQPIFALKLDYLFKISTDAEYSFWIADRWWNGMFECPFDGYKMELFTPNDEYLGPMDSQKMVKEEGK